MIPLLACKFCKSELPPRTTRKAYCNSECKRLYALYGSVENWKNGIECPRASGSRKTSRKQGNAPGKAKKRSTEAHRGSQGHDNGLLMIPVQASNGKEYKQYVMVLDYPESAPPSLTGGANLIQTGGKNAKSRKQK